MGIIVKNNYTLITRHPVILIHHLVKSIMFLILGALILLVVSQYRTILSKETIQFILFPIALLLINYAFMKLILAIINYYNKLIIIIADKLILIDSTLVMREDIELIELQKIVKIDIMCHGIFAAIFGYGHLIIEQQRDEARTLHFVSRPYDILHLMREKTTHTEIIG